MNEIQKSISSIRQGLSIYLVSSIIAAIIATIVIIVGIFSVLASVAQTGTFSLTSVLGTGALAYLSTIIPALGVIAGLFIYWGGLRKFQPALDEVGQRAISNVALGTLLIASSSLLGIFALFLPEILSSIVSIASLAGFVLTLLGYMSLERSTSLNKLGFEGAGQLKTAMYLSLGSIVAYFIPFIGPIATLVLQIMYFIYLFQGWDKISRSFSDSYTE